VAISVELSDFFILLICVWNDIMELEESLSIEVTSLVHIFLFVVCVSLLLKLLHNLNLLWEASLPDIDFFRVVLVAHHRMF